MFGHAKAILTPPKEGSAKPIGLKKSPCQELEGALVGGGWPYSVTCGAKGGR